MHAASGARDRFSATKSRHPSPLRLCISLPTPLFTLPGVFRILRASLFFLERLSFTLCQTHLVSDLGSVINALVGIGCPVSVYQHLDAATTGSIMFLCSDTTLTDLDW